MSKADPPGITRGPRWRRGLWWAAFALCALYAARAMLSGASTPLGFYDEGILFTDAFLMSRGQAIYRDFYTNYPPGIFQVIRVITAVGLPPVWTARLLSFTVDLTCALGAGLVAARLRGEGVFLAAAAAVALLRSSIGPVLSGYKVAVLLALVTIALWPAEGSTRSRRIACGATLGLLSYFRHDLFTYALPALAAFEVAYRLRRRRSLLAATGRELAELTGVAAVTAALLWAPVLVRSGLSRTVHDLVIDQASRIMPGRTLPLPSFAAMVDVPWLGLRLPALLATRVCVSLLLAAAGTAAAALVLALGLARGEAQAQRVRGVALLAAFAAATLPQALMRTEYGHVALGLPLTVAALFGALGGRIGLPVLLLAALSTACERPRLAPPADALRFLVPRDDGYFTTPQRRRLALFLDGETGGQDRIFVGCTSHRRVLCSYIDVYYLARRLGATRYMQFDPGTVTSAEGQAEMIADLERHRPRIALRHPKCAWDEPNASMVEGSDRLDAYLAAHYAPAGRAGGFELWRRIAP